MPAKLNTEFNYRYQVVGETPWEKIKTLRGFLEGRKRAAALEEVGRLKYEAKLAELEMAKKNNALPHIILNLKAELIDIESLFLIEKEGFELNRQEIKILEKLLKELYDIVEPTRLTHSCGTPFTDEEMFEVNAPNEFTVMIAKDIQAEIITTGRPSPAKLRNAMSNPFTFAALKEVGLIPKDAVLIEGNPNPLKIELRPSPSIKTHEGLIELGRSDKNTPKLNSNSNI